MRAERSHFLSHWGRIEEGKEQKAVDKEYEEKLEKAHKRFEEFEKARKRRRKRELTLILLLLLLCFFLIFFFYFLKRREMPLPSVEIGQKETVTPPQPLFFFDGTPKTRHLRRPSDVKIDPKTGNIYVADLGNHRIAVFDPQGKFLFDFSKVSKDKILGSPHYLTFDKKGNLWVSDGWLEGIFVFTRRGRFIKEFLPNGKRVKWEPEGLFFDDQGLLYLTEVEVNHQVMVFEPKSQRLLYKVGEVGQALKSQNDPGLFAFPNSVVVVGNEFYVTDSDNRRVQVFDKKNGKFLRLFVTQGIPRGIDLGFKDWLHIVDPMSHSVLVYDKKGKPIVTFGVMGNDLGQFFYPNGIDCDGRFVYVADTWNHRVDVWAWQVAIKPPKPPRLPIPGWLFWLPLLLPLIWFLRRKKYVAYEDFISRVIADQKLKEMGRKLKKVYVTPLLYEKLEDYKEGDYEARKVLRAGHYSSYFAERLEEIYEVSKEEAITFAICRKGFIRTILFVEDERLRDIADKLNIYNMNYEEFLVQFGLKEPEESSE